MEHAVYAITALRWLSPDEIEEAMMGLLDVDRMQWDLAPAPTRTTTVIDRLLEGDPVVAWTPEQGMGPLGPNFKVGVTPAGRETLALGEEPSGTRLQDLPRF
ncbi:hypothetical protein [Ramlibacter rhizophilus]|uniref:Uncharacterized protein n=1 Tax=Ramlibacter rhizophilus TaxID=1781167 RepID=A0A4Z0BNH7_9BURK|nr:hypothetical protein [Ramlibacter rhizophilus]TFY99983.1 hypothetical protein EZ242_12710 [Ramlibacter rhizophilus]